MLAITLESRCVVVCIGLANVVRPEDKNVKHGRNLLVPRGGHESALHANLIKPNPA